MLLPPFAARGLLEWQFLIDENTGFVKELLHKIIHDGTYIITALSMLIFVTGLAVMLTY